MIIKNFGQIYSALYDLFNFNFVKKGSQSGKIYCQISIWNNNSQFSVDENFRCIVLVEETNVLHLDVALLNRFQKHYSDFEFNNNYKINSLIDEFEFAFHELIHNFIVDYFKESITEEFLTKVKKDLGFFIASYDKDLFKSISHTFSLENSNLENSSEILKNKLFETILDEIMPFTTSDFFLILNNKKNENHIFVKLRAKEKFLNTHKFNFESLLKRISQKEEKLISNSIIIYTYESNIDFVSESNLNSLRIYKVIEICYNKREKDLAKHFYEFMN